MPTPWAIISRVMKPTCARIIMTARTGLNHPLWRICEKLRFCHSARHGAPSRSLRCFMRSCHCALLCFLLIDFRLKAARTCVCSHDQEHGAIRPCVSFHEAPRQTVQYAMSLHVAHRGDTSRRRTIKSASATMPTPRRESVLHALLHASGVRQKASRNAGRM